MISCDAKTDDRRCDVEADRGRRLNVTLDFPSLLDSST